MSNRPNRKPSTGASRRVAPRPSANEPTNRVPLFVGIGIAIVVVVLGIAVFATRSKTDTTTATPGASVVPKGTHDFGQVTVQGAALPPLPDGGGTDPAIGMKAPTITSQTFDGRTVTLPEPGKPAVIAFVAHWCPHCRAEVPKLRDYLTQTGLPKDVNLYTVSTSASEDKPNFPPGDWLNKEQWPVPTVADDTKQQAANAYGLTSFPYFVAVDAAGNVVARTSGEISEQQFQGLLNQAKANLATPGTTAPAPASR